MIVPTRLSKGDVMGNGYGEGGAFAAMLVVKTFRDAESGKDSSAENPRKVSDREVDSPPAAVMPVK